MNQNIKKRLQRLDNNLNELLKDLQSYSATKLNEQPDDTSWSVLQIMNHLLLAEGGSLGYVKKKLSFNPALKKAGIAATFRKTLVTAYLGSPLKYKAPAAIGTESLPARSKFWEVAKRWQQQRIELKNYLAEMPEELLNKEVYKHPFGGRMGVTGMLDFFESHFNRHRKQIYRTLKKIDAVKQL